MRILFVCKYNRFRSRIAETYLKKINKKIKVSSAGLIKGFLPLDKNQIKTAKKFGLDIKGNPKTISMNLLKEQDKIIVIANDIPKTIFDYKWYKNKITIWGIRDVLRGDDMKGNERIVKSIIKRTNNLNKKLTKLK